MVGETTVAPEFAKTMNGFELCEGDLVRFEVRVTGTPQPNVQWFRNDKQLGEDKRLDFFTDDDMYSLELPNCLLSDSGMYRCVASNEAGQASCSAELIVREKLIPPMFTDQPDFPDRIEEGGSIVLEATVSGKPVPAVQWVKDDTALEGSPHIDIKDGDGKHTLIISGAGPKDSGIYKCVANNPAGTSIRTFNVSIEGENI